MAFLKKIKNVLDRNYDPYTDTYIIPVNKSLIDRIVAGSPILWLAKLIIFIMHLFYRKKR